jgi:glutamate-5-semialdehyde dehydrogenase
MPDVLTSLRSQALAAREAQRRVGGADARAKGAALEAAARHIEASAAAIAAANAADLEAADRTGITAALRDRLRLDGARIAQMAGAVRAVAAQPDPVGRIDSLERRPNGLRIGRMSVPLGLVAIVYESRPNVTAEAAALCLQSGNAVLLRGGSEALRSNVAIAACFARALEETGFGTAAVSFVDRTDRDTLRELLGLSGIVDLLIPRGGEGLIAFVNEHARVPVIQHYKGVCHVYVDGDADLEMAVRIAVNAKVQRPGVCNAMETLLVDAACAHAFLPRIALAMRSHGVELRGCPRARALVSMSSATDADWDAEYLDLVLAIAVVDGIDGALSHIARHGTRHTEAIVTRREDRAERFLREVDASLVLTNASTRFNDGGELGLGAEIGISTTKLHAYGAMGAAELTTKKWIGLGSGQIRS